MTDALFYLGFSAFPGIGPKRLVSLLKRFETVQSAWHAPQKEIQEVLGEKLSLEFEAFRKTFSLTDFAKSLEDKQITYITWESEDYPILLKPFIPCVILNGREGSQSQNYSLNEVQRFGKPSSTLGRSSQAMVSNNNDRDSFPQGDYLLQRVAAVPQNDESENGQNDKEEDSGQVCSSLARMTDDDKTYLPPFVLYVKGNVSLLQNSKTIGIVGTRKVTDYGREVTESLTRNLVKEGFVIVSGLALGVDGIAHQTTLENHGQTIAVLGSGVNVCTPREHQNLYDAILAKGGAIVSAFRPGEAAGVGSFPARNKIIAALSQAVVVTEGAEDSGSLLTARDAQRLGRPVFSVPGPITSYLSKGTNNLIKQGVTPISEVSDIIKALHYSSNVARSSKGSSSHSVSTVKGDTKEEQEILDALENEPLHFDEIVRRIGKDSKTVGSLLSLLELKGMIKSNREGKYRLN